ncbi:lamin tail domain-containing protein [Aggregicoccus sp. 17bor-14]|nr:lamin tail domain-containing protein [Simulacricoccus sp. 17bor-14]MRI88759.1 lamin tail domain-containing protein [Aggregicoccus sp. 17bor-14]
MELTGAQVTNVRRAAATPVAVPVTVAELQDPVRATQLVGVLVEVSDVVVTQSNGSDEFTLAPQGSAAGTAGVRMDDALFNYANPTVGAEFRKVRGVLTYGFLNFKVLPRNAGDLLAPLPAIASFGTAGNYIRVGANGDTFPQALSVTLANAYAEDVTVSVVSSDTNALGVANNGQVVIIAGQLSATVALEPLAPADHVDLTATLGSSSQNTSVRVLGANELPTTMTLSPNPVVSAAGAKATVTVSFDIPVAAGTVVQFGVAPADLGSFANASLEVPLNATSATIDLDVSAAPSTTTGTVHAQLGSLTADTAVQLTTALPKLDTLSPAGPVTVASAGTQEFTVALDLPALADLHVTLAAQPSADGATFGTVPASVIIPKDATSATFTFTAGTVNADTAGTVTASLNGVTKTVDVLVQRPPARIASISPTNVRVAPSGTQVFTVTLDRAASEGGATFPVALSPSSLGTLDSAEVSVAAGTTTGTVTFTASATEGLGQVTFGTGAQAVSTNVTVSGAQPGRVVISEFSGGTSASSTDEFVELYNAGDFDVVLDNWKVQYKSATGSSFSSTFTIPAGKTIKAHSYFLLGGSTYSGAAAKDAGYTFDSSASTTTGGHIQVLDANGAVVDLLGWGTANAPEGGPGNAAPSHPASGGSLERKAYAGSTSATMAVNGSDEFKGNSTDTGVNKNDFVTRAIRQPQNSASATEAP